MEELKKIKNKACKQKRLKIIMMMKETTETLWATNDFTSFQLY